MKGLILIILYIRNIGTQCFTDPCAMIPLLVLDVVSDSMGKILDWTKTSIMKFWPCCLLVKRQCNKLLASETNSQITQIPPCILPLNECMKHSAE